jgi:uncharacterized spore protein YtfJ
METEIQTLLDSFADLREKANVNACFGEPVTIEGRTVIPVAQVGYGFGLGVGHGMMVEEEEEEADEEAAEKVGSGRGGVGGMKARPIAVVEVTPEGAQVKPVMDEQKVALAGILFAGWAVFCLARTLARIFERQE